VGSWAGTVCVSAFLLVLTFALSIATFYFNSNDDDPQYVYLAVRILRTGGLVDPFSERRLVSYNGTRLYDALFYQTSGNISLSGFELCFALLLTVFMVVGRKRRRWPLAGLVLLGLGVTLGHGITSVGNLEPVFSTAALSLGVFQLLYIVKRGSEAKSHGVFALVGLLLGGLLAMRFTDVISVGAAVVLVYALVLRGWASVRALAITALTTALASIGWAVSSYSSSRTPLFPVVLGNYRTALLPTSDPSVRRLGAYLVQFWHGFTAFNLGVIPAACLVGAIVLWPFLPGARAGLVVLACAGLANLLQLAVITYAFSGIGWAASYRYQVASSFACALFAIDLCWPQRQRDALPRTDPDVLRRRHSRRRSDPRRRAARIGAVVSTAAAVGMGLISFGDNPGAYATQLRSDTSLGFRVLDGSIGFTDRYTAVRPEYAELNRAIPKGSKVLAALEYPELLDFSKFQFATLDFPGVVSPSPGMPIFQGAQAVVTYLRRLGYEDIAIDSPTTFGLYDEALWKPALSSSSRTNRALAREFTTWNAIVASLERSRRSGIQHFGGLTLISISS
jgi:hypothetical protein